jgi:hypothetical protein
MVPASKLISAIAAVFKERTTVTNETSRALAFFSVATWVADRLSVAPILSISSIVGSELALVLHLLTCFCKHPLLLNEVTPAALLGLPWELRPTVLLHYTSVSKHLQFLLANTSCKGVRVPRSGGVLIEPYGMKVVAGPEHVPLDYAVTLTVPQRRGGHPAFWDETMLQELAGRFEPQLLQFRLDHVAQGQSSGWDVPDFGSPTREIACSLGMCLDSTELRQELVDLLRGQEREARAAWSSSERAVLIEVGLAVCHDQNRDCLYTGELSEMMDTVFEGRGEVTRVKPRRVGALLRTLGFQTEPLSRAGRGLVLREPIRERFHRLAMEFRVRSIEEGIERCRHCQIFSEARAR